MSMQLPVAASTASLMSPAAPSSPSQSPAGGGDTPFARLLTAHQAAEHAQHQAPEKTKPVSQAQAQAQAQTQTQTQDASQSSATGSPDAGHAAAPGAATRRGGDRRADRSRPAGAPGNGDPDSKAVSDADATAALTGTGTADAAGKADAKTETKDEKDKTAAGTDPALAEFIASLHRPVATGPDGVQAGETGRAGAPGKVAGAGERRGRPVQSAHEKITQGDDQADNQAIASHESRPAHTAQTLTVPTATDPAHRGSGAAAHAGRTAHADAGQGAAIATGAAGSDAATPSAAATVSAATVSAAIQATNDRAVSAHGDGERHGIDALQAAGNAAAAISTTPHAGSATAPAVTGAIGTPATAPEFREALALHVSTLARDGVQRAELQLNPAHMGPISVHIALDGSQAQVDFGAASHATRQVIESSLPELAAALRDAGFTLSGGGVSQHPDQGRPRPDAGDSASSTGVGRTDAGLDAGAADAGASMRRVNLRAPSGALDLYA